MTINQFLAEAKAICQERDWDYDAFAEEYCVSSAIIDEIKPLEAVKWWHKWHKRPGDKAR